jgi:hypothetical protein
MSYDPCEIFEFYEVVTLHGLNYYNCIFHEDEDTFMDGWCNLIPGSNNKYYVFINLSSCTDDIETFSLLMHEFTHLSFDLHGRNIDFEEEIITWAEKEAKKILPVVKDELQTNDSTKEDTISKEQD